MAKEAKEGMLPDEGTSSHLSNRVAFDRSPCPGDRDLLDVVAANPQMSAHFVLQEGKDADRRGPLHLLGNTPPAGRSVVCNTPLADAWPFPVHGRPTEN